MVLLRAGRVAGPGAIPAVLQTAGACVLVFGVGGVAAARVLLPPALAPWRLVLVLPLGAVLVPLALTVLGLLGVPFGVSLPVTLAAFALAGLASLRLRPVAGPPGVGGPFVVRAVVPLLLASVLGLVAVVPVLRTGFATVIGQNGDAVLAVGTAELLEHAPPTATRPELPLDRVPLQWRSKLPIYYGLAAVAKVAGQDPVEAFPTVAGFVYALAGLGLLLLAVVTLRAPPWAGLLVLALAPLDRILVLVAMHPFYNQAWGLLALPFILVSGTLVLREPGRRAAALAVVFLALGLFAYPLMLPFPAAFLGTLALVEWRRARRSGARVGWVSALRLPGLRRSWWMLIPAVVVGVPVVATLVRGVAEKLSGALRVLLPGGDLSGWSGPALPYLPFGRFFGVDLPPAAAVPVTVLVFAAAAVGVRAAPRAVQAALAAVTAAALLIAGYFFARGQGELFYFKDLGFLGPLVVTAAIVGLAGLAGRTRLGGPARLGAATALAAFAVVLTVGAAREIRGTYEFATADLLELRTWDRELPPNGSIRIDVPPSGYQLWTWYFLPRHRLSTSMPLGGFFPSPPRGLKADYVLYPVAHRPADVQGKPLLANRTYAVAKEAPGAPGPDFSSRALYDAVQEITLTK